MAAPKEWSVIPIAGAAKRAFNPIRNIVQNIDKAGNPAKSHIPLSIGDPTLMGNFTPPATAVEKLVDHVRSNRYNGYLHSCGAIEARQAIAATSSFPGATLTADDVIITSGCSSALEMSLSVLSEPGKNVLVPRPGFPLYASLCRSAGVDVKYYDLLPEKDWEVDLPYLESLIDDHTAAILVNNPSNPCGAVYTREHLLEIIAVAERARVPIVADEIYEGMVFEGHTYFPMAALTEDVPVLSVGGIAKRFMVPGWRLGYVRVYDKKGRFAKVREGLISLSQLILGANSLCQSIVPELLLHTDPSYHRHNNAVLKEHADLCVSRMERIPGLKCVRPGGAMYLMAGIDISKFADIVDDLDFTQKLLKEESVFVLPGRCFELPNFFRIVITFTKDVLEQAMDRIEGFCKAHSKPSPA